MVTGHLGTATAVVVTGALTVGGCLYDHGPDGLIVVGGRLEAGAVFSAGDLLVRGDIRADVVSCAGLDSRTTASGTVRARLVLEEDLQGGTVEAGIRLDYDSYLLGRCDDRGKLRERLRALLVDEVFTEDVGCGDGEARLDRYELFDRLLARERVFRDDTRRAGYGFPRS
ncbi:hypothetical protein AB0903_23285 [Streptomyces sp. NPDC048389]|uniref:hypothetical protein n=1 Tax=Streptomyces sp. NPDC048389 TaxID=3154622 RepID=UPI00345549A4